MARTIKTSAILLFLFSCSNVSRVEYFFPNNELGLYTVVYNAKNGVSCAFDDSLYQYRFAKDRLIITNDTPVDEMIDIHYFLYNSENQSMTEIFYKSSASIVHGELYVHFNILGNYTNKITKKDFSYQIIWLTRKDSLKKENETEFAKSQNFQIQQMHNKLDSLASIGIL